MKQINEMIKEREVETITKSEKRIEREKKEKRRELIFGIMSVCKNLINSIIAGLWAIFTYIVVGVFLESNGLGGIRGLIGISYEGWINITLFIYLPLVWITGSVLEILEYRRKTN